jgi:hypothetical protein
MRTMRTYLHQDGSTYCGFEPRGQGDRLIPEQPSQDHAWSLAEEAWVQDLEKLASAVRSERNRRLCDSDPMALPDYPHADETVRQAWQDYRQALRNLPQQEGFPWAGPADAACPWPSEPV